MGKVLTFGNEARNKILEGIQELEDAVCSTLGPKGKCVIIDTGNAHPIATKDGVSVARAIWFTDHYKNIGANIVKEAAAKVNTLAGDGTTTSTLITSELCKAGNELVSLNYDAVDIKRGFEKAKDDVIAELDKQKKESKSEEDILNIATISANNDEEIGSYIRDAFVGIGEGGKVSIMDAHNRSGKTSVTFSTGLELTRGLASSTFVNTNNNTCEFENPKFLIVGKELKSLQDIVAILQILANKRENIIVVAPVYSDEFKSAFIDNVSSGSFHGAFIFPDGSNKSSIDASIEDLATLVGAKVLEGKDKITIDNFDPQTMIGSADSICISKTKTLISGGAGTDEDIEARVEELEKELDIGTNSDEDCLSDNQVEIIKERIAKLSGGVATIHIGALSSLELKEKKDRYEDAVNAVQTALEDGILIGGGCGLLHVVKSVADNHIPLDNPVQETGYQTFLKVMEKPARMIIESTGKDPGYYVEKIKESNNLSYGYNAKKEEVSEDLYNDGVIDPVKVEKLAISYGCSIAGTFISTNCVVTNEETHISVNAVDSLLDEDRSNFNV